MRLHPLLRLPIVLVWLYQGLWCKLLGGMPHHQAIVSAVPFLPPAGAHAFLLALGAAEVLLGLWVLSGRALRLAALVQTALLLAMNTGGLLWGRASIVDPAGMVLQNLVFLTLIWVVAGEFSWQPARARS